MELDRINLLVLDVDGVLTSGQLAFDAGGPVGRTFHVQDGCLVKMWERCGGRSAIISGRQCPAVLARAAELGVSNVTQGASDKLAAYDSLLASLGATDDQVCYVGDDLPDLGPMGRCALPVAVYNAVPEVKQRARYVTRRSGGSGAVAEVVEYILRKQHRWTPAALLEA
jgi:3-deoxy-D-manno-octulosonate 8-phosphate phosphatase (KDO 8-P phosphatase)